MNITPASKALIQWAANNEVSPADFSRSTGYSYNHAAMLLRGEAKVTEQTLGRVLLAYGPEVAEPLAALMRANGNGSAR